MDMQRIRMFLLVTLSFIGFNLFIAWEEEHKPAPQAVTAANQIPASASDIPSVGDNAVPATSGAIPVVGGNNHLSTVSTSSKQIHVETDVLKLNIDLEGGDIVYAELPKYSKNFGSDEGYELLTKSDKRYYYTQSGLSSPLGPDSRTSGRAYYKADNDNYVLTQNENTLTVKLSWVGTTGVQVDKVFTFEKGKYLVNVKYDVKNNTGTPYEFNLYTQATRKMLEPAASSMMGMAMYQGGAMYTPDKPYTKVSFDDMESSAVNQKIKGGWSALSERYFLTAWIPNPESENTYFTSAKDKTYTIGSIGPKQVIAAGTQATVSASLYIGPEDTDSLKAISQGLELTVDYGFLWPISQFIFWVLKEIYKFVGNWGWAIILVTALLRLSFYKLSASAYRSMGNLRKLQPKIQAMKERYGDDKQKMSIAMMELYKKEKINPLGGCLPILIQIPVFIALYYVLLESVELRHSPFIFWVTDLASKDPYYVLPILMGLSMLVQQKLNPPPPDPVQAKVMMMLPVIFTVLFLQFPSGLVLYWFVNNLLSILQQWYITRSIAREGVSDRTAIANG